MFHPMVAGVTIPGVGLFGLIPPAPYTDRNPSHKPEDRKFAIVPMTLFLMFWAVLVISGGERPSGAARGGMEGKWMDGICAQRDRSGLSPRAAWSRQTV